MTGYWLKYCQCTNEIITIEGLDCFGLLFNTLLSYKQLLGIFFQANVDPPSLTNDTGVDCIDRVFAAFFFLSAEDFSLTGLAPVLCPGRASLSLVGCSVLQKGWSGCDGESRSSLTSCWGSQCSMAAEGKDGWSAQLSFHLNEQNCFTSPLGITIIKNLYCYSCCIIMNRNWLCTLNLCC